MGLWCCLRWDEQVRCCSCPSAGNTSTVCADPHEHPGGQLLTLSLLMLRKLGFWKNRSPDVKHSYVPYLLCPSAQVFTLTLEVQEAWYKDWPSIVQVIIHAGTL